MVNTNRTASRRRKWFGCYFIIFIYSVTDAYRFRKRHEDMEGDSLIQFKVYEVQD